MTDSTVNEGESRRALSLLDEGIALARAGDKEAAREVLRRVIQTEPENEDAWVWLAWAAPTRERAAGILREAQALMPGSERLEQAMAWAEREPELGPAESMRDAGEQRGQSGGRDVRLAAQGQSGQRVGGSGAAPIGPTVGERAAVAREKVRGLAWRVDRAVRDAQARASRTTERVRESVRLPQVAEPVRSDVRKVSMPILTLVALTALVAVVFLGIVRARESGGTVQAMELPPVPVDATPIPKAEERTANLWVQVDVAWTRENWDQVIEGLERIREIDPYDDEARARLAEAYYNRGAVCIDENLLDEAKLELDTAIRLDATSENLQEMRRQLQAYMSGLDAFWNREWETATQLLRKLYKRNPHFRDTKTMLGESYYRFGIDLMDDERWDEAETALQYAVDLVPDNEDAAVRLQVTKDVITPPKRIVVDISAKTVTLYEHHKPRYVFRVCTGRPTAVTLPGRYSILDKMPEAYASKWDLRMPWWLGIYWAGGSENGFHALPILSNGRVLWSGALGTGCSFGCIVLDTQDAITMYNWAEIGDVVLVNP